MRVSHRLPNFCRGEQWDKFGRPVETNRSHTSKEMCSLPNRISSSCLPSLFFWGHLVSSSLFRTVSDAVLHSTSLLGRKGGGTYFRTSLSLMIRLISVIIREETHTIASRVSQYRPRTRHLPCKAKGPRVGDGTYSPSGSTSRSGSWSCSHIARWPSGRHRRRGSRTRGTRGRNGRSGLSWRGVSIGMLQTGGGG